MALVTIESKRGTDVAIKDSRITMLMKSKDRIHLYLTNGMVVNFVAGDVVYNWLKEMLDKKDEHPICVQSDDDVVIFQSEMAVLRV